MKTNFTVFTKNITVIVNKSQVSNWKQCLLAKDKMCLLLNLGFSGHPLMTKKQTIQVTLVVANIMQIAC